MLLQLLVTHFSYHTNCLEKTSNLNNHISKRLEVPLAWGKHRTEGYSNNWNGFGWLATMSLQICMANNPVTLQAHTSFSILVAVMSWIYSICWQLYSRVECKKAMASMCMIWCTLEREGESCQEMAINQALGECSSNFTSFCCDCHRLFPTFNPVCAISIPCLMFWQTHDHQDYSRSTLFT